MKKLFLVGQFGILLFVHAACYTDDYSYAYTTGPTIVAYPIVPADDAKTIDDYMKHGKSGWLIDNILLNRTVQQRRQIADAYNTLSLGKGNFDKDMKDYFGTYYDSAKNTMELISTVPDFLARRIKHSLKKNGKDHGYLSIMCTSKGEELKKITASYQNEMGTALADDIKSFLGDNEATAFLIYMISDANSFRSDTNADDKKTEVLVGFIPEQKGDCPGMKSGNQFYEMMAKGSFQQIKAVCEKYKAIKNGDPVAKFNDNCKSDLSDAYTRILNYAMDPFFYFALEIEEDIKGRGHIDSARTRVMIARSEIDLADIRTSYGHHYEHGLHWAIKKYFLARNRHIFLRLVDGNRLK